jgi:hypothetical protein
MPDLSRRRWLRSRRRRRRPRLRPSHATRISQRTREDRWPVTQSITRHHRLERYWSDR